MAATASDLPDPRRGGGAPHTGLAAFGVVLAGLVAYANAPDAAFILDDLPHILDNPWVHGVGPWSAILSDSRPLVAATLRLNHALNVWLGRPGLDPDLFHAFNVVVHLATALALFALVRRTLVRAAFDANDALGLAFAVGLLWVVHPLTTQAVTYVIQRAEAMMALGLLASLLALERGDAAATRAQRVGWFAAAVLLGWAAMASKQVAAVLPVVAILYDRAFLAGTFLQALRRRWPVYVLLLAGALCVFMPAVLVDPDPDAAAGFGMTAVSPWAYARTQPAVVLHYLRLAVWPDPLVFDYDWRPATEPAAFIPPLVIIALLAVATLALLARRPRAGFLPACVFIILAPTSSVMPIADLAVEHRMYLPLAAVIAMAVLAAAWALRRWVGGTWRIVGLALAFCAAAPLAMLTIARNEDYGSAERLWRDTIAKAPANPRAHHNLANVLARQGEHQAAIAVYEQTLALAPDHAQARVNLGIALNQIGRPDEAREQFERVLRNLPDYAPALHQSGVLAAKQNEMDRAATLLERAVASDPAFGVAFADLGNVLLQQGRIDAAIEAYQRAIALGAGTASLHNLLGIALAQSGRVAEAAEHFAVAVHLDPTLEDARANLARARELLQIGRPEAGATP